MKKRREKEREKASVIRRYKSYTRKGKEERKNKETRRKKGRERDKKYHREHMINLTQEKETQITKEREE